MARLAAIYDSEGGTKNLLILKGNNWYAWNMDVYVEFYTTEVFT